MRMHEEEGGGRRALLQGWSVQMPEDGEDGEDDEDGTIFFVAPDGARFASHADVWEELLSSGAVTEPHSALNGSAKNGGGSGGIAGGINGGQGGCGGRGGGEGGIGGYGGKGGVYTESSRSVTWLLPVKRSSP